MGDCIVKLHNGDSFIGQLVKINSDKPGLSLFLRKMNSGVFLKRKNVVSYFANETIKEIIEF